MLSKRDSAVVFNCYVLLFSNENKKTFHRSYVLLSSMTRLDLFLEFSIEYLDGFGMPK